jgi:hypothetical protein
MRRAFALVTLLLALSTVLAACGGDNSQLDATTRKAAKASTTAAPPVAPVPPTLDVVRVWAVGIADPNLITGVAQVGTAFRVDTSYARSTEARIAGIGLCNELVGTHKIPMVQITGYGGGLLASNDAAGGPCADRFCVQPHRAPPSCFPEPGSQ